MTHANRDRVMRIIMARCGDVLTDADLDLLGDPLERLPAGLVLDAIAALEAKLDGLADAVAHARE